MVVVPLSTDVVSVTKLGKVSRGEVQNWVPRTITGYRGLHNDGLHNLYSSPCAITTIKSRRMRLAGNVARGEKIGMHTVFGGKRPLGRPRVKWEDNSEIDRR
jgi:hypothetical protein